MVASTLLAGCLLPFDRALVEFDETCEASEIIRCYGFDDPDDLEDRVGEDFASSDLCGDGHCWQFDPEVRASGEGSLRFEVAPMLIDGSGAGFALNFADDLSVHVGEGEEVYVQWRQRFTADMLRTFRGTDGFDTAQGFLQALVGGGDRSGQETDQCTEMQVVVQQATSYMGPGLSHGCPNYVAHEDVVEQSDYNLQTGVDPPCLWSEPMSPPCFGYVADAWMTFQLRIQIGTWNQADSLTQMWATAPGQGTVLVYDDPGLTFENADPGLGFGKVWVSAQNQRKDPTEDHPTAYTWYDSLAISRSRLPDPRD